VDQLWAPWRSSFVTANKPKDDACFICRGVGETTDRANLVVHRTELSVVLLNLYPYNNGHLLIAPKRHRGRPADLDDAELLDLQRVLRDMLAVLERRMTPDGFNVGLNLGAAAGAGLPGHMHWHVVPRWNGDTNFMPVLTDAKVIVQSLDALYDLLAADLAAR
jgi:ATP adenylyltransferase